MSSSEWDIYKSNFIDQWSQDGYNFAKVVFTRNNGDDTGVSEGMGYAMLMAVQNNDQTTFDKLLSFVMHGGMLDKNGLMNWQFDQSGVTETGSATDADEDIAYSLLLAHKQWGSSSSFDYLGIAQNMLHSILANDVDTTDANNPVLRPGDSWGSGGDQYFNPSYVDPTEWAAFAQADPSQANAWNALINSSLETLFKAANGNTGLIANWPNQAPPGYNNPGDYGYDACRTPMRLAEYYQYLHGLSNLTPEQQDQMKEIQSILNKEFKFFFNNQAPGGGLYSGYSLDGSQNVGYGNEACFNGPVMAALSIMLKCGGIDGSGLSQAQAQSFLQELQTLVSNETNTSISSGPNSSSSNYFNGSLGLLNEGWENYTP